MDAERVAELFDPARNAGGSGYLIADRLMVTAKHVVGAAGSRCDWRPASGGNTWRQARVAWVSSALDAALLEPVSTESFASALKPVALASLTGRTPVHAEAGGFPVALDSASRSDILHVEGTVDPISGARAGAPLFGVTKPLPSTAKGWKGMSGAAVFAGGLWIGIVEEVPVTLTEALRLVPAAAVASDPAAAGLLALNGIGTAIRTLTAEEAALLKRSESWEKLRPLYAAAVVAEYCRLDYTGLPGDRGAASRPVLEGFRAMRFVDAENQGTTVEELASQSHLVVIGEPGSGKSTALKQTVAVAVAADPQRVPVWLPVASLPASRVPLAALLQRMASDALNLGFEEADADFFEAAVSEKRLILAFDALDEAHESRRQVVRDLVEAAAREWPGCAVWLTSRPDQYWKTPLGQARPRPSELPQIFKVWRILPLQAEAIPEFLRVCFDDDGRLANMLLGRPDLAALLETPQMLSLLARLANADNELPDNRAQIYGQWVDVACTSWEDTKGTPADPFDVAQRRKALQLIAWGVQESGQAKPFTMKAARRAVAPLSNTTGEIGAQAIVEWLTNRSGILDWVDESGKDAARTIRFRHLQFQEYLAAAELEARWSSDRAALRGSMKTRWFRQDWFETLRFAIAMMDVPQDLLREILDTPDPYDEQLRRGVLLTGMLLRDLDAVDGKLAVRVVAELEKTMVKTRHLRDEACDLLLALTHHKPAAAAVEKIARGTLPPPSALEVGAQDSPDASLKRRIEAIQVLTAVRGTAYGLTLAKELPFPTSLDTPDRLSLRYLMDVASLQYRWGGPSTALSGLEMLLRQCPYLRDRQAIVEKLEELSEPTFANAILESLVRDPGSSLDFPLVFWCFKRGSPSATLDRLKVSLRAAIPMIRSAGAQFFPDEKVSDALTAATALWEIHPLPEARQLMEASLDLPGLIWYWAYRIRVIVPDLARRAVDAMVSLAIDPSLFDNSRRRGMVSRLCDDPDDELVVPALLRLLEAPPTLRWSGEGIAASLAARGKTTAALETLRRIADPRTTPVDTAASALEVANTISPGIFVAWLNEIWRATGDPQADVAVLQHQWPPPGIGPFVRGWLDALASTEEGRAFLWAAKTNPVNIRLSDDAQDALSGPHWESIDDDDEAETAKPSFDELEEKLKELFAAPPSGPTKITNILEKMVDLGHEEEAQRYGELWLQQLDPEDEEYPIKLAVRLQNLSWSDIWLPEWTKLLADTIRNLPEPYRDRGIALLREHA